MANSRCKFYKQVKQVTYDFGQTWTDTTEYRRGDIYEYDSSDCGLMERWVKTDYTMCQYWPDPTPPSYSGQYLTLKSNTTSGYVKLNNAPSTFYYSTDSGNTWTSATSADTIPLTTSGTMFKGTITPDTRVPYGVGTFSASTPFTAESNVMSLLYGDNFSDKTSLSGKTDAFYSLFKGSSITNAENLVLPSTTLADSCYDSMFANCTSLTTAPALPATTLAVRCYGSMFASCSSLATAPELPATTLASNCYRWMFANCTSLTTAPDLLATTLTDFCYVDMFYGCTSLNYIKCLATDISASNCIFGWTVDVSASGTFVKKAGVTWPSGTSGIPSGWTVQNA